MGRSNIPVKTSEGTHEIKMRALGLAPRIRTALLLVDGVKSVAELERLMAAAGVTAGALQLLLDKGLIRFQEEVQEKPVPTTTTKADDSVFALEEPQASVAGQSAEPVIPRPEPAHEAPAAKVSEEAQHKAKANESEHEFLIEVPPIDDRRYHYQQDKASSSVEHTPTVQGPDLFPDVIVPVAQISAASEPENAAVSPLEVATLIELETILGGVTKMEMDTILGIATKLELTPTQMLAQTQMPKTAVMMPVAAPTRLPPLAQAEYDFKMASANQKQVIPAAVLRMNLTVARAHLASALDQHLEIDGYALKQRVIACEARADLEQLFRLVESLLTQKMDKSAVARIMGVAQALLER